MTRGKPISPNNVVRHWIVPACDDARVSETNERAYERPAVIHEGLPTQLPDIDPA